MCVLDLHVYTRTSQRCTSRIPQSLSPSASSDRVKARERMFIYVCVRVTCIYTFIPALYIAHPPIPVGLSCISQGGSSRVYMYIYMCVLNLHVYTRTFQRCTSRVPRSPSASASTARVEAESVYVYIYVCVRFTCIDTFIPALYIAHPPIPVAVSFISQGESSRVYMFICMCVLDLHV